VGIAVLTDRPAYEALPGRVACRLREPGRVAPRCRVQPLCFGDAEAPPQLIGLISGVMTGVTAGAMGFIGAASLIGGLRFAAFLLAGFFFLALRAGRRLAFFDFFFAFLATRFLDERFLAERFLERFFDDFFLDFLEDFFFAFFFAAMCCSFQC
jgi:hypothetical protein